MTWRRAPASTWTESAERPFLWRHPTKPHLESSAWTGKDRYMLNIKFKLTQVVEMTCELKWAVIKVPQCLQFPGKSTFKWLTYSCLCILSWVRRKYINSEKTITRSSCNECQFFTFLAAVSALILHRGALYVCVWSDLHSVRGNLRRTQLGWLPQRQNI